MEEIKQMCDDLITLAQEIRAELTEVERGFPQTPESTASNKVPMPTAEDEPPENESEENFMHPDTKT